MNISSLRYCCLETWERKGDLTQRHGSYMWHRFPLQQALEHTIKCPEQNTMPQM